MNTWKQGGVTAVVHEDGALELRTAASGHALNLSWATELAEFLRDCYLPPSGGRVTEEPSPNPTPVPKRRTASTRKAKL